MKDNQLRTDPVMEWLGAYLDGELNAERRAWVETHLANCAACRAELAELRALSSLLHADPEPALARSAQRFAAGVLRGLPASSRREFALPRAARYLPLGLFGLWAMLQALVGIASALLFGMGYLPGLRSGLSSLLMLATSLFGWSGWFGDLFRLLGFTAEGGWLGQLERIPWVGVLPIIELILVGLFAVIFLAWLAGLWSARRAQIRA